jgi:NAD(P)H-dependent FMN reductase
MSVDCYKTIEKSSVNEVIETVLEEDYIIAVPIEHYSQDELKEFAKKAKENDLLLTIKAEYSNAYQGILVQLIKKNIADKFLKHL